jgi:hypothetical protein
MPSDTKTEQIKALRARVARLERTVAKLELHLADRIVAPLHMPLTVEMAARALCAYADDRNTK